jgi:hypothetical protein
MYTTGTHLSRQELSLNQKAIAPNNHPLPRSLDQSRPSPVRRHRCIHFAEFLTCTDYLFAHSSNGPRPSWSYSTSTMSTVYTVVEALWTVFHSFLYGFHISALNGVQEYVMCEEGSQGWSRWGLKSCVDMNVRYAPSLEACVPDAQTAQSIWIRCDGVYHRRSFWFPLWPGGYSSIRADRGVA